MKKAKLKIDGKTLRVWAENVGDDDRISIMCRVVGDEESWYLGFIDESGITLAAWVPDSLLFKTDGRGRLKVYFE